MSDITQAVTVVGSSAANWCRAPRCRVLIDGKSRQETQAKQFSLMRTRYSRADTLTLTFAVDRQFLASARTGGVAGWFDQAGVANGKPGPEIDITLQMQDAALGGAQWATVFQGMVTTVSYEPLIATLDIECRDYLARLLDMRVLDAWMNMTGPEIIKDMASRAGLTADVSIFGSMQGQFRQTEHKRHSGVSGNRFRSAFDLARYIANSSQADLYVDGTMLVCRPMLSPSSDGAVVHKLAYVDRSSNAAIQAGCGNLTLRRDYQIAKGVMVHVLSWDSRQRTKVEWYFGPDGGSARKASESGNLHSFQFPGLRMDEVQARAEQLYHEIIAHERVISYEAPGIIALEPRQFMSLTGTNSTWDGTHAVDAVTTSYGEGAGFRQNVTLRNRDVTQDETQEYD
ncbi:MULTISPECIES: hypothetical protein [Acetobacter]|uniref:Uncharacterized protein n=2 Tax=Acetobacter TaxID=434 RepID=A0AAN1PJF3_9PROT|nr:MULTISPECIES: hypothetical protein [Acetobacter]ASL39342.1 hypothetical protein CBI36_02025 [Acetobacter oryzifermentans]AXN01469.1 hypothetical protein CJF59_13590 [Acetobacter pomorum]KAA8397139.1 hypothetical protein FKW22_05050 [Acetobacter sp. DmW_125124]KAA8397686.1 hypothetical protein FKW20_08485 [Acetobacter sp. DmW_125127]KAA8401087.1 hypothetical protein FKW19_00290 [Acetobacter sp. DmW_125128]